MGKRLFYAGILCFLLICSGCSGIINKKGEQAKSQPGESTQVTNEQAGNKGQIKNTEEKIPIILYFSDKQEGKLIPEKRDISKSAVLSKLEETIVNELIKGPTNKDLMGVIPQGTKLLSVKKENGMITVDLSKEFVDNHPGGSTGEMLTIYSIVNSLTELKDIDKVKFMIEGKTRKEYKGHLEFDVPFARDEKLINRN